MIFIAAKNFHEAKVCAFDLGLRYSGWAYADSRERLQGHRNSTIVFYSDWRSHPNAAEIELYAKLQDMKIETA